MTNWKKQPFWIMISLAWGFNQTAMADPCLRLQGVVEDYTSHRPLLAQLYLKTPKGQYSLGASLGKTGQFSIDINCPATALIIEKKGYRSQTLQLDGLSLPNSETVGVIIPLVAVDQPGIDRPYFQTEQTHFIQKNSKKSSIQPQHNTFIISDALTGQFLAAQTCFFFTKNGQKRCLDTAGNGEFSIDFTEKDIVAIEVNVAGYQTYHGNMVVEEGDSRQLRHNVRLTRALTLLSVRIDASGGSCELRADGSMDKPIRLRVVPGMSNIVAGYDLLPQQYALVIMDRQQVVREQRPIMIRQGLNVTSLLASAAGSTPVVPMATVESEPDSALRFEQGSYTLLPASKGLLMQMASYLKQYPNIHIRIMGHTDKEGNEQLNRQLSEFRAKVVSTFLGQRGVADERMEIVGLGSRYLIAPSDTEENKAKNRRVTIKFINK